MAPLPRIAVVAMNALPVVLGQRGRIGGLETFAWNLARSLAKTGFETGLVVRAPRNPPADRVEDVRLLADVEPLRDMRLRVSGQVEVRPGFPWISIRRWRPSLIWEMPVLAVARAFGPRRPVTERMSTLLAPFAPDVVIALGVSEESRAAIASAHALGARALLWLQSNADLDSRWISEPLFRNSYGVTSADARACLAESDRIIAQTEFQRARLRDLNGRDAAVIFNPVDVATYSPAEGPASRRGVLWIGRYDRFHKRPLLALEIAERCPGLPFTLVINDGDPEIAAAVSRSKPDNVTILDSVPRGEMPARFRQAQVFLSTGSLEHEGFPNVLLEAAASGTPVVTLEDFDGYIGRSRSGIAVGGDVEAAARAIRSLVEDAQQWTLFSHAAREHAGRRHSIAAMLESLRPLLQSETSHSHAP